MRWDSSARRSYFWEAGLAAVEGGVPSRGPAHLNSQENEQIKKWALIKLKFFLFHYLFICVYIYTIYMDMFAQVCTHVMVRRE